MEIVNLGSTTFGVYGDGSTPTEALNALTKEISEKTIQFYAMFEYDNKQYNVPKLDLLVDGEY